MGSFINCAPQALSACLTLRRADRRQSALVNYNGHGCPFYLGKKQGQGQLCYKAPPSTYWKDIKSCRKTRVSDNTSSLKVLSLNFPYARRPSQCFTFINSFSSHNNSVKTQLCPPVYRWGNWRTEGVNNPPKVTPLVSRMTRVWTQAMSHSRILSFNHSIVFWEKIYEISFCSKISLLKFYH